ILNSLAETMREGERLCTDAGIRFTFTIHSADFIQEMSARLAGDLFGFEFLQEVHRTPRILSFWGTPLGVFSRLL
ncbi:MAG: hypothetical protein ACOVMK_05175, partial [Arenimonas sp.]